MAKIIYQFKEATQSNNVPYPTGSGKLSTKNVSNLVIPYLYFVSAHGDGVPVVGGKSDGEQGHRHQAEDGGKGQG